MPDTSKVVFEDVEHTILPVATLAAKGMVWHFCTAESPDGFASLRGVPFDGSVPVRILIRKKSASGLTYHVERIVRTSW